ncbi:MAG: ABC transporter permease [Planctomycetaceae bacterium]
MGGWNITKKDLLLLCRDGRALAVLLMLPMLFIVLIGMSVGPLFATGEDDKTKLQIAIWDQVDADFDLQDFRRFYPGEFGFESPEQFEQEEASLPPVTMQELIDIGFAEDEAGIETELKRIEKNCRMLTDRFIETFRIDPGFKIQEIHSQAEADDWIRENVDKAMVVIGPDFWTRIQRLQADDIMNRSAGAMQTGLKSLDISIESRTRGAARDSLLQRVILGQVQDIMGAYVACETSSQFRNSGIGKSSCPPFELEGELEPIIAAAPVQKDPDKAQLNEAYIFIVPGFTVMFVFFLVNIMARSFLQEKHQGTLRRLQMAPLRPASVLIGKTVPFLLISLVQTILLFIFGRIMFGMSWGTQPLLLLPVIFFTSLAATGLGLVIAMVVKTDSQVSSYSNLIVIMMAGVSGCIIPPQWMNSAILRNMSLATPHYWSLNAFGELLKMESPRLSIVAESCGVLLAFAAFFFVLGSVLWRRKLAT